MSFLRFCDFSRLSYLLALTLALPLVACSGGGGSSDSDVSQADVFVVSLSWLATLRRENNTGMLPEEIVGYRIYYGTMSGYYPNQFDVNDSLATQAQISGIPDGTYHIVITALDTDGRESTYSSEVIVTAVKVS